MMKNATATKPDGPRAAAYGIKDSDGPGALHPLGRNEHAALPFQAFDAVALLRHAVEIVRSGIGSSPTVMDFVSDRESLPVLSDAALLESMAVYLLSNAAQNTDRGRITLILNAGPSLLRITVTDTGRGMTEERKRSIFSTAAKDLMPSRADYGLVIIRRLIDLSGGALEIASRPGEGTIIQIILPVLICDRPTVPSRRAPATATA